MHIILRFELEQDLVAGTLSTADLPDAWNARFEEYLGIPVPDDRLGVLQDVHWSAGLFGYFPTYQLGNVMSVQIWEAAQAALPGVEERFAEGEFGDLGEWLRENLYSLGRKFTPKETLERVVGGPIDPEPYLRYLHSKYGVGVAA
jgi:carboxypeptidase Taq